ncbi:uncharacterized protein TNCV_2735141 [Trichonephila clavipes]|nr:uncharacterized protein TNCV_2735141 [Trichonephila clavipes]
MPSYLYTKYISLNDFNIPGVKEKDPLKINEECKHYDVTKDDYGWYVCWACHEELRYDPNKRPISHYDLYASVKSQQRIKHRVKNLTQWIEKYNLPFGEELLFDFFSFIHKFEEFFQSGKI